MNQGKVSRSTTKSVMGLKLNGRNYAETADQCIVWARKSESRAVLFANVHMVMEAYRDPSLRRELNSADLVNPDGVPIVWALRALGKRDSTRVCGSDATLCILHAAADAGISVGFLGGSERSLHMLLEEVQLRHPILRIGFQYSPPFRALTPGEDTEIVKQIKDSGIGILFVGLGCPKQELWIMNHREVVPAVMLAVGAAFDFVGGAKPQAPRWMMPVGLEWVFRLCNEPKRLWRRYLLNNPTFIMLILLQILGVKSYSVD